MIARARFVHAVQIAGLAGVHITVTADEVVSMSLRGDTLAIAVNGCADVTLVPHSNVVWMTDVTAPPSAPPAGKKQKKQKE